MLSTRENEFWTTEPLYKGSQAFVLASGPGLTQEIADRVRGRGIVVAINATAWTLAPWADVWFFTDNNIYTDARDKHAQFLASFNGEIITLSKQAKRELPDRIKRVKGLWAPEFAKPGSDTIRQGRSSGHTGVSLLVTLGVMQQVLLGYDMRVVDGREHHHDEYASRPRDLDIYEREFVPAFNGWFAEAAKAGCEILNATPDSAVTEFPMVTLDEVLACARS